MAESTACLLMWFLNSLVMTTMIIAYCIRENRRESRNEKSSVAKREEGK